MSAPCWHSRPLMRSVLQSRRTCCGLLCVSSTATYTGAKSCYNMTSKLATLCAGEKPQCHAWHSGALYLGCSSGRVFCMDVATAKPYMASPQAAPGGPKQTTIAEPGEAPAKVVVSCCLEQAGWPQAVTCLAASRSALAVGGNSGSIRCPSPAACAGASALQPVGLSCSCSL